MARLAGVTGGIRACAEWLGVTVLAIAVFAVPKARADAQSYPRLHVIALAQRADRASVAPGDVFHVTIHARIGQRRERIDELILGSFANCEIISNETVRTSAPDGTDFVERLTVQALAPGDATISPAYIDAIDPAIGRPMRYSSNAIRVSVSGGAALASGLRGLEDRVRRLLLAVAIVASCAAALFVLGVIFVRRRRSVRAPASSPAPPGVPPVPARERLLRATDVFAMTRSEGALMDVRAALFDVAGVVPGATLLDALRGLRESQRSLRPALLAAERAMFGPAAERSAAGDDLLAAVRAHAADGAPEGAWTR